MGGRSSKTEEQPKRVLATSPTRTSSVCATSSNYSLNQNEISEHLRCEQPSVVPPVHSVANVLTLEPSLEALIVGYLSKTTMIAQLLPRRGTASTFVLINTDTVCSPECYRDSVRVHSKIKVVSLVKIQGNFPELKYRVLQFTYLRPNSVPQDREVVMVTKKVPGGALVVGMSFPMPTFVACNDDFKEDDYLLGRPTWLAPEVEEVKLCGIQCFIMNYENRERLALNKLALVDASFVGDDKTLENEILKADFMTRDDKKLYVTDVQNVRACHLEMEQKRKKTKTKTVQKTVLNTTVPPPNPSVPPPNYVAQVQSPTPSNSGPLSSSLYEGLVSALSTVSFKDRPATSGVVVGRLDKTRRIVQTLPEVGMSEWLVLDDQSKNLAIECDSGYNKIVSDIHTFIKITKKSSLSDLHFNYHVDEYYNEEVTDDSTCQELVAVFNADSVGVVTVVGNSFVTPTLVPWELLEKPLQSGDFLIGNVHRLQPFFSATMMNGIVCYTKNLEEERKYIEQLEIHKRNRQAMKIRSPANMYYLTRVRPVYQGEIEKIANNCRHMQDLSISDANLYIRDVYIAIARLEKFMRLQSIEEHTLHVPGLTNIDRSGAQKRISLTVKLNEEETQQVVRDKSQDTWRVGTDLSIRHSELERYIQRNGDFTAKTYEGGMTIERIDFDGKKCSVRLRPHPRSYDLFDMIANSKERLEGTFTIGPTDEYVETIVQALQSPAFTDFVMNRDLFDSWRGFRKNETVILDNTDEEHHINGDMLDDSQSNALNIALQNPGFTCIEAPPGSGKTFLIAALVGAKYRQTRGEDGSICITATTNNAISNAIDKAHDSFPQIRCIREYSRKMEGEINPKSKEISLREMAINAGKHLDLNKHLALAEAIDTYQECKVGLRSISNVEQGLTLLDELQSADYHLRGNFLEAYQPYVVGTTCELVARRGDHAARKLKTKDNDEKKSEQKRLKRLITHLILDEASQLPPHLALAVYIMLPGLQKITLIGDSEQLGPYTPLNDRTFCYNMIGFGELDRVGGMPHSNKKVHLRHVYRSHPRIVDLLLTPIYGKNLTSALKVEQRSLAKEKGLPCADDSHKSPVLFVNIDKAKNNERGVNEKELAVVLAFIDALKKKGVTGEDVAVVCNHHAQREALLSAMKGKGTIGLLNATVAVHTVDSFQGKEAKVVLLLTTKVSPNSDKNSVNHTFQFIANPNRGTVAVSRGQHAVYLFGEWFNLVKTEFWSKFVPGIVEAKAMVDHEWNPVSCDDYDKLKLAASEAPKTVRGVQSHYTGRGRNHRVSHKQFHRGAHVRGGRGRGVHVQGERRPHHGPISGERKEHRPPGQQHNNRGKQNNRGHRGAGRRARENSGNQESERPQGQQS